MCQFTHVGFSVRHVIVRGPFKAGPLGSALFVSLPQHINTSTQNESVKGQKQPRSSDQRLINRRRRLCLMRSVQAGQRLQ
jgi:hypothetical protein